MEINLTALKQLMKQQTTTHCVLQTPNKLTSHNPDRLDISIDYTKRLRDPANRIIYIMPAYLRSLEGVERRNCFCGKVQTLARPAPSCQSVEISSQPFQKSMTPTLFGPCTTNTIKLLNNIFLRVATCLAHLGTRYTNFPMWQVNSVSCFRILLTSQRWIIFWLLIV